MQAVAALLTPGLSVADVGCDHAHVSIYLIENGLAASVIAMDIGEGPLARAQANIRQQGLSDVIATRLSDGGKALMVGEVDACIIAGMGGMLMEKILRESADVFMAMKELILAPQSDLDHFRGFITENGLRIVDEDMILEEGKFYPVIKAVPVGGDSKCQMLTKAELAYGPVLLGKKHRVLLEYLNWEKNQKETILASLVRQELTTKVAERIESLKAELEIIDGAIATYQ